MVTPPLELYIAWRYIRSNLRQSLIIALAVGIGVSIIIFIPSVNLSFFGYFLRKTVENSAHLRVTRDLETMPRNEAALQRLYPGENILFSDQTLTRRRNIQAYRRMMGELLALPGVVEAAPYISEQIIIVKGSQVRGASLNGIVPEREQRIRNLAEEIQEGNIDTIGTNEVFLGWRLADELNVDVGQRVLLDTAYGDRSFKVAGLINSGIYQRDMDTVLLSLDAAQQLLGMPNAVTGIGLKIRDIYGAEDMAGAIERTYGLEARSWMEDNAVVLNQISMFRVIIAFISFLIVFAAASSITSVLIMVVSSKSKEIGILKAMGTPAGVIMRMFLIQAVFLAVLGSLAGVAGGQLIIAIYNATPAARAETFLGVGREPVTMNMEYLGYAIFYAMVSSILASLFPAWRAGRLDPVKAINQ